MLCTTSDGVKTKQWALLVVVVLIVVAGYWLMNKDRSWAPETAYPTPTPSSGPAAKAPVKKPGTTAVPAGSAKSYTELVKEYGGNRIQFDQYCQAVPTDTTFKSGSSVMLDNRSGDARYVKVGDESHYLSGYGYKLITISSSSLPKEIWLSCGSAVNVGKILLQGMLYQ